MTGSNDVPRKKLSKVYVDSLAWLPEYAGPSGKTNQKIFWDSTLTGFGLRLTAGSKTYIVESRVNGKTVRVKLGNHGVITAEEARKEATKHLGEMAKGTNLNEAKRVAKLKAITLGELFDAYLESKPLKGRTPIIYRDAVHRSFADWVDKPITVITAEMVEKRHKALSNTNGPRGKGGALANQAMRVLRSLMNYALHTYRDASGNSVIPYNPVVRLKEIGAWNKSVRRQTMIHREDMPIWFKTVLELNYTRARLTENTMRDYLLLCLFTGLRRTEAAMLQWDDINFRRKTLRIRAENTKTREEHILPLPDVLFELLSARHKKRGTLPWIFPGEAKGGQLGGIHWTVKEKIGRTSGINFMMHDLRRTFITVAEALDISPYAVKQMVNHKLSSDVTAGYIVTDSERLREPMQRVSDAILAHAKIDKSELIASFRAESASSKTGSLIAFEKKASS